MSDAGLSPSEQAHIQQAADQAFRILTNDDEQPGPSRFRVSRALRKVTREAPLQALTIAFLLGVLAARRR
jgi:hypothetical protein